MNGVLLNEALKVTYLAHREEGEITAAKHALGDALWLMHRGNHERLTDQEMLVAIRKMLGFSWSPQPEGEAA